MCDQSNLGLAELAAQPLHAGLGDLNGPLSRRAEGVRNQTARDLAEGPGVEGERERRVQPVGDQVRRRLREELAALASPR